jgi:hypothetical protein
VDARHASDCRIEDADDLGLLISVGLRHLRYYGRKS